jgi:heme exporter protein A
MEVTVTDLACRRGDMPVLAGVSFRVPAGRCLLIRGPNGAGKTTLLRALAGLTPPVAGRIAPGPDAIAYAGHSDGLKAQLTVAENLAFWAALHGGKGIDRAVARFDLAGLAGRRVQYLSAGQKRRLGLARLMLTGRPVWALDEPTVSLDAARVATFGALVAEHCATGRTAVIATHTDIPVPDAAVLDLTPFAASRDSAGCSGAFDEAFA